MSDQSKAMLLTFTFAGAFIMGAACAPLLMANDWLGWVGFVGTGIVCLVATREVTK